MRTVWRLALIALLIGSGAGCSGSDHGLAGIVELGNPTVPWTSLGMAGIEFSLTNQTGQDITLDSIRLVVDKRTSEAEEEETNSCLGTKIDVGDLFFNISRDSRDPGLKVFGSQGGEAPTAALRVPADSARVVVATLFNHLANGKGGREVDACRVRVQIELDGATSTSPAVEIHFNEREQ